MSESKDNPNTDDAAGFDPADLYRTHARATFDGHLSKGPDVRAAGVDNGDKADHPVPTLCGNARHGPFAPIDEAEILDRAGADLTEDERDLCGRCLSIAAGKVTDTADPDDAPVDPADLTVAELTNELDKRDFDADDLTALRAAEVMGKNRKTALEAIADHAGGDGE